jgi:phytoene desaturase
MKHVIVVGGGLGGLAVALRLAARGHRVTVCEQHETFGGKMNVWRASGFSFDTGPSLITMPHVFADLFAAVGERMEDHLELVAVNPLAEYVYADGTRFACSASLPEWLDVVRRLDPRDVDGFFRFMKLGAKLFALSRETFLRRSPLEPPDTRTLAALRHLPLRHGWGNYHRTVAAHFRSPYLQQLYDRYPTYVGSSPYESPATLIVIPYLEWAFGGWHVRGGLYRIVESLVEMSRRRAVELRARSRVQRILVENGRARGVQLEDGETLRAEVVVFNGDASCMPQLLGASDGGPATAERSLSGFVLMLGVRRTLPELNHHAIYFSADYRREFQQLFDEQVLPDDPTVYVCAPSRTDRSLVPGEGETLFIMINAPACGERFTADWTNEARARIMRKLKGAGFPEIGDDIVVEDVWTPRRIEATYAMPGGAIYGANSHGWRRAFLRPPNKDRRIAGLYYVGGSSHPGGGTPTVLLSAEITSRLIERHET